MSVGTYSPSVRVGNWYEDIQLEDDTLKDFLEKRERGELHVQKSAGLRGQLSKPVSLSIARAGSVFFGSSLMLLNPPLDNSTMPCTVCVNLSPLTTGNGELQDPCDVCAGVDTSPIARNNLIVTSMDGTANGESLRFGQPFYLFSPLLNMYLQCDRATFLNSSKKSRHNKVVFVKQPSHLTEWQVLPFDPLFRMELDFTPVPANKKVIINHVKTNQNLCAEYDFKLRTMHGRECELTAHSVYDSHKAETNQNHWLMLMSVPGDPICSVPNPSDQK